MMTIEDIVARVERPEPWTEGSKIPWHEPEFSERMLHEHLNQSHDMASRRGSKIDQHLEWMDSVLLTKKPSRVLDLACGPGLYSLGLAERGHRCKGIDFAPASIRHAEEQAKQMRRDCEFHLADIRKVDYGSSFDLVLLIFGEFNLFRRSEAEAILGKAHDSLLPKGRLLLEVHTFEALSARTTGRSWYSADEGLFSSRKHLCLTEDFWDSESRTQIRRYYVIDAETCAVTRHASTAQAYAGEEYLATLEKCGFSNIHFIPSLLGKPDSSQKELFVVVAERGGRDD
jgi:SAM-dependent methyltransferase